MADIIPLALARHLREQDRKWDCEIWAARERPNLLSDFLDDMATNADEIREMLKRMIDEEGDFLAALMRCEKLQRSPNLCVTDTAKAALADKLGELIRKRADGTFGGRLEDAKFQEMVNA